MDRKNQSRLKKRLDEGDRWKTLENLIREAAEKTIGNKRDGCNEEIHKALKWLYSISEDLKKKENEKEE